MLRANPTKRRCRIVGRLVVVMVGMALLTGCTTYTLRGIVVSGDDVGVRVVDKKADVLAAPPIQGARLRFTLDPNRLDRKDVGSVLSGYDGSFELPIDATGAGLLEYDILVNAEAPFFGRVREVIPLPGGDKRVVIMLRRGGPADTGSTGPNTQDVLEESLQYGRDEGLLKD